MNCSGQAALFAWTTISGRPEQTIGTSRYEPETPRRKPVVLVVTNIYPTSERLEAGAFVAAQVESLRALGVQVDIAHVRRDLEGRGVYRHLSADVSKRLRSRAYDLIHVMYGGVMAERVTRIAPVPVVISFCGSDLNGVPLGSLGTRLSAWYGVRASRRAADRAAAIIVKSESLRRRLPGSIDASRIVVVPNGVDLDIFRPLDRSHCLRKLGWSDSSRYILLYGRDAGKRADLSAQAVHLAARGSAIPIEIRRLRNVEHGQVPIWMNACHGLLCTSVSEGSPNTVKEALACDVPVISTDVGDVRQRIAPIAGCHLVEPDATSIAVAVREIAGGNGRVDGRRSMKALSLEAVARRVLHVYDFARGGTSAPRDR